MIGIESTADRRLVADKYVSNLNIFLRQHCSRDHSGNGYSISIKNKVSDGISATKIQASTKTVKTSAGKSGIKLSWKKSAGYAVDYYAVYRSTKKSSGYSKVYTIKNGKQTSIVFSNGLKKGMTYYFKVRGVRKIEGKTYYTKWSNCSSRKV